MPLFRGQWVDDLDEAKRRFDAQYDDEPTSIAGKAKTTKTTKPKSAKAPNPDPDGDRIGDGQGPFSSDQRDVQEAEQERTKVARAAAGVEPHEDDELEAEAVAAAKKTAPDGLKDHTGRTGSPDDAQALADLVAMGSDAPAAKAEKAKAKTEDDE